MTELRDGFLSGMSSSVRSDRRAASRHDATRASTRMVAKVIGASEVRLLDLSRRGVMLETAARLQFGAKASIRFSTSEASVSVRAQVVRSRIFSLGEVILYHTALAFDEELPLADVLAHQQPATTTAAGSVVSNASAQSAGPLDTFDPFEPLASMESLEPAGLFDQPVLDVDSLFARDGSVHDDNGELLLNEALNLLVTMDDNFDTLEVRTDSHGDD